MKQGKCDKRHHVMKSDSDHCSVCGQSLVRILTQHGQRVRLVFDEVKETNQL